MLAETDCTFDKGGIRGGDILVVVDCAREQCGCGQVGLFSAIVDFR